MYEMAYIYAQRKLVRTKDMGYIYYEWNEISKEK